MQTAQQVAHMLKVGFTTVAIHSNVTCNAVRNEGNLKLQKLE